MQDFIETIAVKNIRNRFEDAIRFRNPFQNFTQMLQNYPDLRLEWFQFIEEYYKKWVAKQLDFQPASIR